MSRGVVIDACLDLQQRHVEVAAQCVNILSFRQVKRSGDHREVAGFQRYVLTEVRLGPLEELDKQSSELKIDVMAKQASPPLKREFAASERTHSIAIDPKVEAEVVAAAEEVRRPLAELILP